MIIFIDLWKGFCNPLSVSNLLENYVLNITDVIVTCRCLLANIKQIHRDNFGLLIRQYDCRSDVPCYCLRIGWFILKNQVRGLVCSQTWTIVEPYLHILYTIPWQRWLLKAGLLFDWFLRNHMEPIIRDDLS